ncbi:MAG: hypothetical protein ACJ76Y_22755 [Thermoanaerobaculia bacterium]
MEDAQKQRFAAIASLGVMAIILVLTAKTYLWFSSTVLSPPAPASTGLSEVLDAAPKAWPQVARDLAEAKSLTIYSILPGYASLPGADSDDTRVFHGFPILGRARVTSLKRIGRIAESLTRGVSFGAGFSCFFPRHGVRADLRDGRRIDLVICYSCDRIEIHGARGDLYVQPGPSRDALNGVLRAAGVDPNDPRLLLPWEKPSGLSLPRNARRPSPPRRETVLLRGR